MRRNFPVLTTLVVVLSSCLLATAAAVNPPDSAQPEAPPRIELRGTVLDGAVDLRVRVAGPEEEPISGAHILLRPLDPSPGVILALVFRPPRATDSSGETAIDSLAPGSYEVALTGRPEGPCVPSSGRR